MKLNDDFPKWVTTLTDKERKELEKKDRRSDAVKPKKETEDING